METHFMRRTLSILLSLVMLISAMPIASTSAADTAVAETSAPTVEIVSFMRGTPEDGNLRSSELLEARVTGYDGNVRELTYVWTNTLGTYLYVYNSHNMYYINNTDGEVEIYNDKVASSTNMAGRSYKDSFTGVGYCWAAIYGSNTSGTGSAIQDYNAYNGTISVKVYDGETLIGEDSHEGIVTKSSSWWNTTYKYSGIVDHSLQKDMDDVTIGIFEGDKRNVKDLLGESAILHITCVQSTVQSGKIESGSQYITLTSEDGDYYITGKAAGTSTTGDAKVTLTIKKGTCKFHEQTTATATTIAYIFKKPTTSTTAYTLTLTGNLDSRCRYFIEGNEGVKQADGTILFTGLKPNTQYMVEVQAEYKDDEGYTRHTYAYVYDTTKPIYNGTVEVYLNGTYDSATHTAEGTRVNLEDVTNPKYYSIYAKDENSKDFVELSKKADTTGIYSSILDTGSYHLYYTDNENSKIDDQLLTMHEADRTRYLFFNSVDYMDGDTKLGDTEYYVTGSAVTTRPAITKEGSVFAGWKDADGNIYPADAILTDAIAAPYVLKAVWVKGIDVTVNVILDHIADDGVSIDINKATKFDVSFDLMHRAQGSNTNFADVLAPVVVDDTNYTAEKTTNEDGFVTKTVYTAKAPNLTNVAVGMEYAVEASKSDYENLGYTTEIDAEGNVTITVTLKFSPSNSDLTFNVELDEASKELIKEYPQYKPVAADVKVSFWSDSAFNEYTSSGWHHIVQHHDTYITVYLDENGEGTGTYPVWSTDSNGKPYYYRIEVVSFDLSNGDSVDTNTVDDFVYVTPAGRYKATVDVERGMIPENADTALAGAYFDANDTQQGDITAVVSIKTHTVTFEPDGGMFADGTTDEKSESNLLNVPDLSEYTVTRDGGYVFLGWYVVDRETGETTDILATSDKVLHDDLTLRAVWRDPITVEGVVSVAGYYYIDDARTEVRIISETARAHAVTVYLQKFLPNGYTETIHTQKVDVHYPDLESTQTEKPMGQAQYVFTALPDDGTQYRILIANPNYTTTYQNEPESIDADKTGVYTFYNEYDFTAELGETDPLVADVNAFMIFTPTEFELLYKVIASSIGEGFRPSVAEVLVLSRRTGSDIDPHSWPVITQMVDGDTVKGNDTFLKADGNEYYGNGSQDVWMMMLDGHTLYDYAVLLKDYTINGTETQFDATSAPFFVYYNGSARYSAREDLDPTHPHQTQLLTIELAPKRYNVDFNVNFTETESDHIEDFENYTMQVNGKTVYHTGHIWSYETDLSDAIPTRKGYNFLGWYDKNGNLVTKIDAGVAEDVVLTAKWEELFTVTFHANNSDIDEDIFRVYYEQGNTPDGAMTLNADNTISSFYDIPEFEYETHNKNIFKGWYLDPVSEENPVSWTDVYTEDTHIYAHWITSGTVSKDAEDTKQTGSDVYSEYDLIGVQIREIKHDSEEHYGTAGSGLRFITVLSENVYQQINDISEANKNGAEYGFVVAKKNTIAKYAQGDNYNIQYKGSNVNGVDTTADYSYVQNMKCSGLAKDHRNYTDYRLYTAVITYDKVAPEALESAHMTEMTSRAYLRYTDANGLYRTYYNNYEGVVRDYSACSASFDFVKNSMMQ